MRTPDRKRANAANASKSTGPKTARGRAISSSNARTHGLTSAPPWDDVTRYYRIITGQAAARPDPMSRDPGAGAALALAEAEAQYARSVAAERDHLVRMAERAGNGAHVALEDVLHKADHGKFDLDVLEAIQGAEIDAWTAQVLRIMIRADPDRPAALHRRIRTLRRYRREAEARRRKAMRRWRQVMIEGGEKETADSLIEGSG